MNKQEFKKAYSEHREKLSKALRLGRTELSVAMRTNPKLTEIVCNKRCDRPVSLKVWIHRHKG